MEAPFSEFPDLQTLTLGLASIFAGNGCGDGNVTVLDRNPAEYPSTFPSEIVTCQFGDGTMRRLLCKYAAEHVDEVYNHKSGGAYEAQVYVQVLQPLKVSTPAFFGTYFDPATGRTWLILEYLEKSLWANKACDASSMTLAARWIGNFHAANQARLATDQIPWLRRYDPGYYLGWVRRTLLFAGRLHQNFPWLANLCARAEELLAPLSEAPETVIHGEYYPENILFCSGTIYAVDWESAAIAPGEIDFAALTEGWTTEVTRECELEYQRARWSGASPSQFQQTLAAARLYLHFRWLGDRPEWTTDESFLWHFEHLRSISEGLAGN